MPNLSTSEALLLEIARPVDAPFPDTWADASEALLLEIARPVDAPFPDTWADADAVLIITFLGNKVLYSDETDIRTLNSRSNNSNSEEKVKSIISYP